MIILKNRVFLKSDKEKEVLLFSYDQDQIYKFEGDCAIALKIINDAKENNGISKQELIEKLNACSPEFQENPAPEETIDEFLEALNDLELLGGKI